jgi:iron(III) transport system ATP-binding protein
MKVLDNVMYGLNASNVPKDEAHRRAMASLENVGLTGYEGRWPAELSGGQQQRVAVARALVLEPAVLLFDEPLSNLDARLRRSMREEIRALQQRLQLTVVYVTHDQGEALAVSDKIIVMNEGRIAQMGTPRELYMKPADEFVAAFMGDALILDAQATGVTQLTIGPLKVELAEPHGKDGAVRVAARPEAWRLVGAAQHEDFAVANQLNAKVKTCAFLGSHFEYTLDTELGELLVFDRDLSRRFEVGSAVGVGLDSHTLAVVEKR